MKVSIEKVQSIRAEFEVPEYFTTLAGWYYRVLGANQLMTVTASAVGIYDASVIKHLEDYIKPCTQDEFVAAYCTAINAISAASGIEHLPLLIDNTSNPES